MTCRIGAPGEAMFIKGIGFFLVSGTRLAKRALAGRYRRVTFPVHEAIPAFLGKSLFGAHRRRAKLSARTQGTPST